MELSTLEDNSSKKQSYGCLDVYIVAVHHPAPRVKEVSINLCGLLSDYVHVAKQYSKNLEKLRTRVGFISDWDLGCSVMTPQTLSSCTSCHFEGGGVLG